MLDEIKLLTDNFDTYVKYLITSDYYMDNYNIVYKFDHNIKTEIDFVDIVSFNTKDDVITLFSSSIKKELCSVQANKSSACTFKIFSTKGIYMIYPDYSCTVIGEFITQFELPISKNDYFNIIVQNDIVLSLDELNHIYNFMKKNKELIREYNLEFEISPNFECTIS